MKRRPARWSEPDVPGAGEVADPDLPGPDGGLSVALEASAAGLAAAQPGLRHFLEGADVEPHVIDRAEVVFEEVVMNVAMHAFDDAAPHRVALHAAPHGAGGCELVFEDAGRPFDPTAPALPERPRGLTDAPEGGLGLVLLRRLASAVSYERLPAGLNRLRVVLAPS